MSKKLYEKTFTLSEINDILYEWIQDCSTSDDYDVCEQSYSDLLQYFEHAAKLK